MDHEALRLLRSLLIQPTQGGSTVKEPSSRDEAELLECLERLPLAISHAAAFMQQTSKSVYEYLQMFMSERTQAKLLRFKFRGPGQYNEVGSEGRSFFELRYYVKISSNLPDQVPNRFQQV
jgi:hypothetical protein